jgi:predicted NBD/HSP70 family sugar kinase
MRYVAASLTGETIATISRDLPDVAALAAEVDAGIRAVVKQAGRETDAVRAVGFSAPGLVSGDGVLAQSPNLGWRDVPLRSLLGARVPYPLYIDNNANAAAVAEYMFGRGIDVGDFAYVESGSGVGCGLFLDGGIYRGSRGFAGEFGHTKIVPQGRICRCGNLGCVSAYVSDFSIYQRLLGGGVRCGTREEVTTLADAGNELVLAVLDEAGRHLGAGLANLVNLLDISLFILGGGLEVFAPWMMAGIRTALRNLALPSALEGCRIESSKIGSYLEPRGGVALALEGCTSSRDSEASPWDLPAKVACG